MEITKPLSTHQELSYVVISNIEPSDVTYKEQGIMTISNRTYHVMSLDNFPHNSSDSIDVIWYGVRFYLSHGLQSTNTPNGKIFESYVTFPDDPSPVQMKINQNSSIIGYYASAFSTHTNPQAGVMLHNGTIQLLVNWPKIKSDLTIIGLNDTSYGNCCQDNTLAPPLQQIKQGRPFVSCEQSLQMVKRVEDGASACIKPESMISLVHRGWAKNPLYETEIPVDKQTPFFDMLMNYDKIRNWSKTGWKYAGYVGSSFPNGTSWYQFDLYLPPGSGHPQIDCNLGWHA